MADSVSRDAAKLYLFKALAYAKSIPADASVDTIKGKRDAINTMWDRYAKFHTTVMDRTGTSELETEEKGFDTTLEAYCSANSLLEAAINHRNWYAEFKTCVQVLADHLILSENAHNSNEEVIAGQLKTAKQYYDNAHKLFVTCTTAGVKPIKEKFAKIHTDYLDATAKWEAAAKQFITIPTANQNNGVPAPAPQFVEFKVKPVPLPKFTGNSDNWEAFRDMFKKGFHERNDMSKVVKFQHLKASLGGEAELIVRNIQLSEDNYDTAWALLLRHFDNESGLVKTHLRNLFSQGKCSNNASDIATMLAKTVSSVQALKNLGCPTDHWGDVLVYIVSERLDSESNKLWEQQQATRDERPKWTELETFLYSRVRVLTSIGHTSSKALPSSQTSRFSKSSVHSHQVATSSTPQPNVSKHVCADCRKGHRVNFCMVFRRRTVNEREKLVSQKALCRNCLGTDHNVEQCSSDKRCLKCGLRHNSLLHPTAAATTSSSSDHVIAACTPVHSNPQKNRVLLSTARVLIHTPHKSIALRALLDQGSQSSFITEAAAQLLQLPRQKVNVTVTGLSSCKAGTATSAVQLHLGSLSDDSTIFSVNALVLGKLTSLSTIDLSPSPLSHLQDLQLADPSFCNDDRVDILLGADIYGSLLMNGLRKGAPGTPTAQRTALGWILSGPIASRSDSQSVHCGLVVEEQLRQFWEIEEIPAKRSLNRDELACEEFYAETYHRDNNGRFTVRLPLCVSSVSLGDSYKAAATQMYGLERRFKRNPTFHKQYQDFIQEYMSLGHMERAPATTPPQSAIFYIPHHAVLKESSSTTKLRVVFDASRKTSNGKSLNDQMFVGPRLQQDLFAIIVRWRKHKVVFTTDIEKMFRQIVIDPRDRDMQRILWRSSEQEPLQAYRLTTVTYGTASAPYLAIKSIRQLAENERAKFPLGSSVLLEDAYVDDILSGSFDVASCLAIQKQLIDLLRSGGFVLKKWTSNNEELLAHLPPDHLESKLPLNINIDDNVKTLGIEWNPCLDLFTFSVSLSAPPAIVTKRNLLSDASKLYDPLGWLSPSIVLAKLMFQHLWTLDLGWDDPLCAELSEEWISFREGLTGLRSVKVPRWIQTSPSVANTQIHGFCDASMKAYAAVVYIRVTDSNGHISTSLLTSKTKVAPLKTISLPKLELCGAVLLSRLLDTVIASMQLPNATTFAWSDSEIVLSWLKATPNRWSIFVANRVAEIQNTSNTVKWQHVISKDNPADLASRGIHPTVLHSQSIWWDGPSWLRHSDWPAQKELGDTQEEIRPRAVQSLVVNQPTSSIYDTLFTRCSDWSRLHRIHAYVLRFCFNARNPRADRKVGYPSSAELLLSRVSLCRGAQTTDFKREFSMLRHDESIPGKLSSLNPYIDSDGLLRVGGRLKNSMLTFSEKHPIIVSNKSALCTLLIRHAHETTLHSGAQCTLGFIRRSYWIIDGRNAVRHFIQNCTRCIRYRAVTRHQLMGDLPSCRVTPSRPFTHTGLDFSGSIQVRSSRGRGHHATKAYVALFVCMATRAVHLELVSDLTSTAFIAAFKRFTSRRGICSHLYSDNATNFVGAYVELQRQMSKPTRLGSISKDLLECGTTWHFSPPVSPHFNGISESGIRSIKHHLKRVIGDSTLTFEELYTLLTQIEACLNSRPIHALSNDADDPTALTPGHFLIGEPLNAVPETSLVDANPNRLTRWQMVQQRVQHFWKRWSSEYPTALTPGHFLIGEPLNAVPETSLVDANPNRLTRWQMVQQRVQHFWKRWSSEYLHFLQQRQKWRTPQSDVLVGDVVLLKEDNMPPGKWSLGLVTATHPGPDGRVRVATIRSKQSSFKRCHKHYRCAVRSLDTITADGTHRNVPIIIDNHHYRQSRSVVLEHSYHTRTASLGAITLRVASKEMSKNDEIHWRVTPRGPA